MKKTNIIIVIIIVLFLAFIGGTICYSCQYTESRYSLSELKDGTYAVYYTTHSRVPSQNYEVVTLCCNGNIYTFNGKVNISFTDKEPFAIVKDTNMVNSDEIHVYIPQETVEYQQSINISKY